MARARRPWGLVFVILGLSLFIFGHWMIWDWMNAVTRWLDWARFNVEFSFVAPFWLYVWRADQWTMPFDIGTALDWIGFLIGVLGGYLLARRR